MSFDVPDNLYYLESHEWIDPDTGRVGISDFAQDELGDVVFVELPGVGDELDADSEFGVVESIKAVSDIYAPVSGEVTDVNETLEDEPELVNDDPFGDGWLVELDFDDADLDDLLTAEEYRDQIA
ncbi:glycine cleavage system protein GcvH [Halobacterium litoreum]|uniref:Probable glycine cleavage system H protein n=1 Tax=Halobacterium litoreum TaxID=2039234 RepID=A0ABD5ND92_9EURY|nr:glycine cleavage system protein GcvH [Halobacterium litoreum]UHH14075.1 glycine cleavage system protein GcvH [Halobacterium litoreum]